ncbi:hypothetical protein [Streptomyces sp. T028]|uniref:hypothetical protein n=1 Tax=Streptomyces sp. T028 TaxID=3394379 RepID=UPI003A8C2DF0
MRRAVPQLADRAREAQRLAPVGSLKRKGAGVAAVLLDGAPSLAAARRRLAAHRFPPEIRQAAAEVLDALERGPEEPAEPDGTRLGPG